MSATATLIQTPLGPLRIPEKPAPSTPPKPPLSQARIEANRKNAQNSTGPRTPKGKAIACANALKHGFTGSGIVLHPLDREALQTRVDGWFEDLRPRDRFEEWALSRAALASIRADRCAASEQDRVDDRLDDARDRWFQLRETAIGEVAKTLDADPKATVATLISTGAGCEWLASAWDQLARALQSQGHLTGPQLGRILTLGGRTSPPEAGSTSPVASAWLAGLALLAKGQAPAQDLEAARVALGSFLNAQRSGLQSAADEFWDNVERKSLIRACNADLVETCPEAEKLGRYEKANAAEALRFMNQLYKHRRELAADERRVFDPPDFYEPCEPACEPVPQEAETAQTDAQTASQTASDEASDRTQESGSQNEPKVVVDIITPSTSAHSGQLPGGPAPAAEVTPAAL